MNAYAWLLMLMLHGHAGLSRSFLWLNVLVVPPAVKPALSQLNPPTRAYTQEESAVTGKSS